MYHDEQTLVYTRVSNTVSGMQVKDKVAVHVPCSSKKMGIEAAFMNIASRCAHHVQPSAVPCCGMAGDRGMRCDSFIDSAHPEYCQPSLKY